MTKKTSDDKGAAPAPNPKTYRAKCSCYDVRLYEKGEERISESDLDPSIWEEVQDD